VAPEWTQGGPNVAGVAPRRVRRPFLPAKDPSDKVPMTAARAARATTRIVEVMMTPITALASRMEASANRLNRKPAFRCSRSIVK